MLKENIKLFRKSKGLSQEGVAIHSFEWVFIRIAPIIFIGLVIGIFLTKKKG